MIESSINSVRVSIAIKKSTEVEILLTHMLERFMTQRADRFEILRKKPAHKSFDFSFLISNDHLLKFKKEELINFILEFVQGIDAEVTGMRLAVSNHCRLATCFFSNGVANNKIVA